MYKIIARYLLVLVPLLPFSIDNAYAWHGKTHKKLIQDAIEILCQQDIPQEEKDFFNQYKDSLFKGSVKADKYSRLHHIYFSEDGEVEDNSAALTSKEISIEAIQTIQSAKLNGKVTRPQKEYFAEICGEVGHMIEDVCNGLHTISDEDQMVHEELESEVDKDIRKNGDNFESETFQIIFDGEFKRGICPYDAGIEVAKLSHFGDEEIFPARKLASSVPMGKYGTGSYVGLKKGWKKPLIKSVSKSLNIASNSVAEVLDYMYTQAFLDSPEPAPAPDILQTSTSIPQLATPDISGSVQH